MPNPAHTKLPAPIIYNEKNTVTYEQGRIIPAGRWLLFYPNNRIDLVDYSFDFELEPHALRYAPCPRLQLPEPPVKADFYEMLRAVRAGKTAQIIESKHNTYIGRQFCWRQGSFHTRGQPFLRNTWRPVPEIHETLIEATYEILPDDRIEEVPTEGPASVPEFDGEANPSVCVLMVVSDREVVFQFALLTTTDGETVVAGEHRGKNVDKILKKVYYENAMARDPDANKEDLEFGWEEGVFESKDPNKDLIIYTQWFNLE